MRSLRAEGLGQILGVRGSNTMFTNKAHTLAFSLTAALTLASCGGSSSTPAGAAPTPPIANSQITVATTTGTFSSIYSPSSLNTYVFYGIRYAAPPVGALRWQPPTAATPPAGTFVAVAPGNACPQPADTSPIGQSEDCLFLNVWVPTSATATSNLPVYFYIHGGALVTGTGAV